jgi:hypothetical protein
MEYEKALEIISSPKFAHARDDGCGHALLYTREHGMSFLLGICGIYEAKKILRTMGQYVEPSRC